MKVDFLIAKNKVSNRYNISLVEVKFGKNYTYTSLNKFRRRFAEQTHTPYLLHMGGL